MQNANDLNFSQFIAEFMQTFCIQFLLVLFLSRRSQILYSGGDSTTTKDGATVFDVS